MGRNGEGGPDPEYCCMCGDQGLSSELFTCKNCKFRSQHKYCSNLYPRAESYNICNWCLSQKEDKKRVEDTKTCPDSSHKIGIGHQDDKMNQKKRVLVDSHGERIRPTGGQIKKLKKPPVAGDRRPGPSAAGRKRIMGRTRSEEVSNGGNGIVIKQVFRNKVRRYKLLDEVSS